MRDIKFRGKRVDNGEWVYGNLRWISGSAYIETCSDSAISVFKATVGQFTGLCDKKHQECYFDDVVKHDHGWLGIIKWDNRNLRVYFEWNDGKKSYPPASYEYIDFEIIGNIHENELLEKAK